MKKILVVLLTLCMVLSMTTTSFAAEGEDSSAGTVQEPGTEVTALTTNAEGAYVISTLAELKCFRDTVNAGTSYHKETVVLTADIDLGSEEWTPIGNSTNKFKGTFDGGTHTIKNLVITGNNSDVGLFGFTTDGEIKDLTVENAKVSGRLNVAVVAGTPYTSKYTNVKVTGHVEVKGMSYVGAVGGKNAYADWTDITVNVDDASFVDVNSVENGIAYRTYVGGVIGFIGEGGHTFKNITSNIDVIGSTCDVGGITGIAHYGNNFVNITCSGDVTILADNAVDAVEAGGIAGVWNNGGSPVTFDGLTYTGTLSAPNAPDVVFPNAGLIGAAYSSTGTGVMDGDMAVMDGKSYDDFLTALAAAQSGSVITMLNDVTIDSKLEIKNDLTINGDGHTMTYTGSERAINVSSAAPANLTINDLTVDCTGSYCERGINYNCGGQLTLTGVTVKGKNVTYAVNLPGSSNNATVVITNSDISGNIALNIWGKECKVTVTDTHLTSIDTAEKENYSALKLNNNGETSAEGTEVIVKGGSITALDEKGEESIAINDSTLTGSVTVSETQVVGEIKETEVIVTYPNTDNFYGEFSLQDAFDKAVEDNTEDCVKLIKDMTLTEPATVSAPIVLDVNGKTLTGTIQLAEGATLTAAEGLDVQSAVDGYDVAYENGTYSLVKHVCKPTEVPATAATCTTTGNEAHYKCSCGNLYEDAAANKKIEDPASVVIPSHTRTEKAAEEATCTTAGNKAHYVCSCGKLYEDAAATKEIIDPASVVVPAHTRTQVPAVAATCTTAGNKAYYKCSCGKLYEDAAATKEIADPASVVIPAHTLTEVPAKAATTTAEGNIRYWICSCGKWFVDAAAKMEITDKTSVVTAKLQEETTEAPVVKEEIKVQVEVKEETVVEAVDKAVEDAIKDTPAGETPAKVEVTIDVTAKDETVEEKVAVTQTQLPTTALDKVEEKDASLTVAMTDATVTLDEKAVEAVVEKAATHTESTSIVLSVDVFEEEHEHDEVLTDAQEKAVDTLTQETTVANTTTTKTVALTVKLTIETDKGDYLGDFKGGNATIVIPYEVKAGHHYEVYYIDDNGNVTKVENVRQTGNAIVFNTGHFSEYVVLEVKNTTVQPAPQPQPQAPQEQPQSPHTGDNSPVALLVGLMTVAGMFAVVADKKRRQF